MRISDCYCEPSTAKAADARKMEMKGRDAWNKADPDLPQLRIVTDSPDAAGYR